MRRLLERIGILAQREVRDLGFAPQPGQLVSVIPEDGDYAVMKILAVHREGVHVRLYVQRFKQRPAESQLGELTTAPFAPEHDNPFSIGHVPLSYTAFVQWSPQLICARTVDESELEGYRMWQEARAGYF